MIFKKAIVIFSGLALAAMSIAMPALPVLPAGGSVAMPIWSEGFVYGASDTVFRTKPGKTLNYRSVTVTRGETFLLERKGKKTKAKAKAGKKGILAIQKAGKGQWKITGRKPGTTTVKVKQNGKTSRCKVKVLPYRIGKHSSLFISHRGYAEKYPENTGIALQKAAQVGFRGSAIDLVPTKPDRNGNFDFAVSHDDTLKSMTARKGLVRETPAREIRKLKVTKGNNARKYNEKMLLLDEAVDILLQKKGTSQLEMKNVWTKTQTDRLADKLRAKKVPDTWQVESADVDSLKRFNRSQQERGLSLQTNLIVQKAMDPKERIDVASAAGISNIHIYSKNVDWEVVDYCREREIGIGAYTKMGSDANAEAKRMEPYHLDWLCVSDIPWYQ